MSDFPIRKIEGSNQIAPINNPNFTGTPYAPTATAGLSNKQIANTEFVHEATKECLVVADVAIAASSFNSNYFYEPTDDTAITSGKTYYTRSGVAPYYTWTAVASPAVASLSSYYEKTDYRYFEITGAYEILGNFWYKTTENAVEYRHLKLDLVDVIKIPSQNKIIICALPFDGYVTVLLKKG